MTSGEQKKSEHSFSRKEIFLVLGLFLLAAWIRLAPLASASLSEAEASTALQAWNVAKGTSIYSITQPLHCWITAFFFSAFGANELTARLFPALCGILLALFPLTMISQLGKKRALILSFFVTVDPALSAWSTFADGLLPTICFSIFALVALSKNQKYQTMTFFVLALADSERFYPAFLAMPLAGAGIALIYSLFFREKEIINPFSKLIFSRKEILFLFFLFLIIFTNFFRNPFGLNAFSQGLIAAFTNPVELEPQLLGEVPMLIAFLTYAGFSMILFIIALITQWKYQNYTRVLAMLFSVLFCFWLLVFRQGIFALVWISPFLWLFATLPLETLLKENQTNPKAITLFAVGLPVIAFSFFTLRVSEILRISNISQPVLFQWAGKTFQLPFTQFQAYSLVILIGIIIFLVLLPSILDYYNPGKIKNAILFGICFMMIVNMVRNTYAGAGFNLQGDSPLSAPKAGRQELIFGKQTTQLNNPILQTVQNLNIKKSGFKQIGSGNIALEKEDKMLSWEMRNISDASISQEIPTMRQNKNFLLTDENFERNETKNKIGQKFDWKTQTDWNLFTTKDWLRWALYRIPPNHPAQLTYWENSSFIFGQESLKEYTNDEEETITNRN